jgi:hypothetical protein
VITHASYMPESLDVETRSLFGRRRGLGGLWGGRERERKREREKERERERAVRRQIVVELSFVATSLVV